MRHPHENNNEPVDFVAVVDVVLAVKIVVLEELRGCAILLNLRPTGIKRNIAPFEHATKVAKEWSLI